MCLHWWRLPFHLRLCDFSAKSGTKASLLWHLFLRLGNDNFSSFLWALVPGASKSPVYTDSTSDSWPEFAFRPGCAPCDTHVHCRCCPAIDVRTLSTVHFIGLDVSLSCLVIVEWNSMNYQASIRNDCFPQFKMIIISVCQRRLSKSIQSRNKSHFFKEKKFASGQRTFFQVATFVCFSPGFCCLIGSRFVELF